LAINCAVECKKAYFFKFTLAPFQKRPIMRAMPTGWCESSMPGEFEIS